MKKILSGLGIIIIVALPQLSFASINRVQHQQNSYANTGTTSQAVTLNGVTTGNTIILQCSQDSSISTGLSGVTDNQGDTYVEDGTRSHGNILTSVWRADNVTGGNTIITCTGNLAMFWFVSATEYSGMMIGSAVDTSSSAYQASNSVLNPGTITTATSGEAIFVAGAQDGTGGLSLTYASGFTGIDENSSGLNSATYSNDSASAGSYTGTSQSWLTGSDLISLQIAYFMANGSSTPPIPPATGTLYKYNSQAILTQIQADINTSIILGIITALVIVVIRGRKSN